MSRSKQRLSPRDADAIQTLARQLAVLDDGAPSPMKRWLASFRELCGMGQFILYGLQPEPAGYSLTFSHFGGRFTDRTLDTFDSHLRKVGRRWGLFDPMRPEPLQRNRAIIVEPLLQLIENAKAGSSPDPYVRRISKSAIVSQIQDSSRLFQKIGILHSWQLRALICKDGALLGRVGGFYDASPTWRERSILQALIPALGRRLELEEALGAPRFGLVLATALEEIPGIAFVVGPRGTIDFANMHGRAHLDRSPIVARKEIVDAVAVKDAGAFRVVPVQAGGARYHLVIGPRPSALHERLVLASRTWALTAQQTLVLELVIQGHSNKIIAHKLNCATHTAELHVAAIREKAGAESRSDLAAKFWITCEVTHALC